MKNPLLFLLCFTGWFSAQAQTTYDTEFVSNEELQLQQLVDAKNCFFKKQEAVSRLWKLNVLDLLNTSINVNDPLTALQGGLEISYEQRLQQGWSLNATIGGSFQKTEFDLNDEEYWVPLSPDHEEYIVAYNSQVSLVELKLAPRWYYQKKKAIREGHSGNNLSGNYVGFQGKANFVSHSYNQQVLELLPERTLPPVRDFDEFNFKERYATYGFSINFGRQQQFIKNGFFDIQIGGGIQRRTINRDQQEYNGRQYLKRKEAGWSFPLSYALALGFTLDDHQLQEPTTDCFVFEYHTNNNYLFKVGLVDPYKLLAVRAFFGNLTLGYERKIKQSPFSINANMINYLLYDRENDYNYFDIHWELEPRYYYNLKKRMMQGKTGNNFSANYIGVRSQFSFGGNKHTGLAPVLGMQRQFFRNILFDYKIGPEWLLNADTKQAWFFSELKIAIVYGKSFKALKKEGKKVFAVKRKK